MKTLSAPPCRYSTAHRLVTYCFVFAILFLVPFITHAQKTIDYTAASLSGCNVFSSSFTVNDFKHQTTKGFPSYDGTNKAVSLRSNSSGGTEYNITASSGILIKAGATYKIVVNAAGFSDLTNEPLPVLKIKYNNAGNGSNTSTNCTGPQALTTPAGVQENSVGVSGTFTDYTLLNFVAAADNANLLIAAATLANSSGATVLVRKITITETVPQAFTLSPTTVSANCGYPVSPTFTVNNPGIPNVTQYVWNSPVPSGNGWLFNGAPAVFPITTTTNTLSLTSSCDATSLSSISVTVSANSTTYGPYTASTNFSQALPAGVTIDGVGAYCASEGTKGYTLLNPPPACGPSNIVWSVAGNASVNPTVGTQTNLTPLGSGTVNLTAAVTTACATTNITKTVALQGAPSWFDGTFNFFTHNTSPDTRNLSNYNAIYSPGGPGTVLEVFVDPVVPDATSITWTTTAGSNGNPFSVSNNGQLYFRLAGGYVDNATYKLVAQSPCGSYSEDIFFEISGYAGNGKVAKTNSKSGKIALPDSVHLLTKGLTVYPNPVLNNMVTVKNERPVQTIKIVDQLGVVRKVFNYQAATSTINLRLNGLTPGTYFIQVFDGKQWNSKPIVLK